MPEGRNPPGVLPPCPTPLRLAATSAGEGPWGNGGVTKGVRVPWGHGCPRCSPRASPSCGQRVLVPCCRCRVGKLRHGKVARTAPPARGWGTELGGGLGCLPQREGKEQGGQGRAAAWAGPRRAGPRCCPPGCRCGALRGAPGSPLPHTSAPLAPRPLPPGRGERRRRQHPGGARWLAERPQALGERESAKEPGRAEPFAAGLWGGVGCSLSRCFFKKGIYLFFWGWREGCPELVGDATGCRGAAVRAELRPAALSIAGVCALPFCPRLPELDGGRGRWHPGVSAECHPPVPCCPPSLGPGLCVACLAGSAGASPLGGWPPVMQQFPLPCPARLGMHRAGRSRHDPAARLGCWGGSCGWEGPAGPPWPGAGRGVMEVSERAVQGSPPSWGAGDPPPAPVWGCAGVRPWGAAPPAPALPPQAAGAQPWCRGCAVPRPGGERGRSRLPRRQLCRWGN